jgi:hypothetical protein
MRIFTDLKRFKEEGKMKKNLPTQDSVKRLMEQTLKNILSCVGGVYYNKYKLRLERKKDEKSNKNKLRRS